MSTTLQATGSNFARWGRAVLRSLVLGIAALACGEGACGVGATPGEPAVRAEGAELDPDTLDRVCDSLVEYAEECGEFGGDGGTPEDLRANCLVRIECDLAAEALERCLKPGKCHDVSFCLAEAEENCFGDYCG